MAVTSRGRLQLLAGGKICLKDRIEVASCRSRPVLVQLQAILLHTFCQLSVDGLTVLAVPLGVDVPEKSAGRLQPPRRCQHVFSCLESGSCASICRPTQTHFRALASVFQEAFQSQSFPKQTTSVPGQSYAMIPMAVAIGRQVTEATRKPLEVLVLAALELTIPLCLRLLFCRIYQCPASNPWQPNPLKNRAELKVRKPKAKQRPLHLKLGCAASISRCPGIFQSFPRARRRKGTT